MDEYKKLLNCNRNGFDFFNIDDDVLLEQHQRYYKNSKDNYEKMHYMSAFSNGLGIDIIGNIYETPELLK